MTEKRSIQPLNAAVTLAIMRAEGMDHEHAALGEVVARAEQAILDAGADLSDLERQVAKDGHYRATVKAELLRTHFVDCFDAAGRVLLPEVPEKT